MIKSISVIFTMQFEVYEHKILFSFELREIRGEEGRENAIQGKPFLVKKLRLAAEKFECKAIDLHDDKLKGLSHYLQRN